MKNYLLIASLVVATLACKEKNNKVDPNQAPLLVELVGNEAELVKAETSSTDLTKGQMNIADKSSCAGLDQIALKDSLLSFKMLKFAVDPLAFKDAQWSQKICKSTYSVKVPAGHYLKVKNPKELAYSARVSSPEGTNTMVWHRLSLPNIYSAKDQLNVQYASYPIYLKNKTVEPVKVQMYAAGDAEMKSKCYSTMAIARIQLEITVQITGPAATSSEPTELELAAHEISAGLEYVPCGL
ncbi:MAG: hypothetical protein EOP04_06005 [Proteobacteria bacterium]|nr:MAG: hypothetical protein EOP04_06005 [Pseudomonadota bacterium]